MLRVLVLAVLVWAVICLMVHGESSSSSGGFVYKIDESNFETEVKTSSELWLLEFYAPWCGHCKKLKPVLDELALKEDGETKKPLIKVGVIDATANKKLAMAHSIKSFPTIKYYKDGSIGAYEGPRTVEGFVAFRNRMHAPAITVLDSNVPLETQLDVLLEQHPDRVIFLITHSAKSGKALSYFQTVANSMQAEAHFASMEIDHKDGGSGGGVEGIAKVERGRPFRYMQLQANSLTNTYVAQIEAFVRAQNYQLVSSFDNHNFKALGSLGKPLVIAVIDPNVKDKDSAKLKEVVDAVASKLSHSEADKYVFGYLDGVKYKEFLKQYQAKAPCLLILDLEHETHYTELASQIFLSVFQVKEKLKALGEGNLVLEKAIKRSVFSDVKNKFFDYYPYSLLCFLPLVFMIVAFFVPIPQDEPAVVEKKNN